MGFFSAAYGDEKNIRARMPCAGVQGGSYARLFPKEGFGNYGPVVLQGNPGCPSSMIFADLWWGWSREITVWWFIMLQEAGPNQPCFSRNHYLWKWQRWSWPLGCRHLCKLTFLCLCRYYGLSIWFPDVIKHLQSNVLKDVDDPSGKFSNLTTNFTTTNKIVSGLEWDNGRSGNI